jgi:hypothetical protein
MHHGLIPDMHLNGVFGVCSVGALYVLEYVCINSLLLDGIASRNVPQILSKSETTQPFLRRFLLYRLSPTKWPRQHLGACHEVLGRSVHARIIGSYLTSCAEYGRPIRRTLRLNAEPIMRQDIRKGCCGRVQRFRSHNQRRSL